MKEITGTARPQAHIIDLLFALALFGVFAASALVVVLIGAGVYEGAAKGMEDNFGLRASVSYVTAKVRQGDARGAVRLAGLEGIPALVLEQEVGGAVYETWIYHHDGMLREALVEKGTVFPPGSGQGIVALQSFRMEAEGELLLLRAEDSAGEWAEARVGTRCPAGWGGWQG